MSLSDKWQMSHDDFHDFWNDKPVPKSLDDMKITVRKVLRKDGKPFCTLAGKPDYLRPYAYHPACDQAKLFAQIAGTETFTDRTLATIEALGFDIRVVR